jgi:hypothetical protein
MMPYNLMAAENGSAAEGHQLGELASHRGLGVGFGRMVAFYHRSSTSCQMC